MIRTSAIKIFLLLAVILSSCSQLTLQKAIPTPTTDKANVTGKIVSINTGKPYIDATVRLAKVFRNELGEGAYALDAANSPLAQSDDEGNFIFTDIEAGEYVLMVGDPMTRYVFVTEDSGKAKVFNFPANEITDLGEFKINYDS